MKTKLLAFAIAAATASGGALAAGLSGDAAGSAGAGVTDRDSQMSAPAPGGPSTSVESGSLGMSHEGFDRLDSDADGQLSREEIGTRPELAENWDRIDANRDGSIDQSEFSMFEEASPADGPSGVPSSESLPGAEGGIQDRGVTGGGGSAGGEPSGLGGGASGGTPSTSPER